MSAAQGSLFVDAPGDAIRRAVPARWSLHFLDEQRGCAVRRRVSEQHTLEVYFGPRKTLTPSEWEADIAARLPKHCAAAWKAAQR